MLKFSLMGSSARATSAAPRYFKPFVNASTKEGFLDGALFHNNPVRIAFSESQLIWPDIRSRPPDILLSLGTGQQRRAAATSVETGFRSREGVREDVAPDHAEPPSSTQGMLYRWSGLTQWLQVLFNRMEDLLDGDQIWWSFNDNLRLQDSYTEVQSCQRLNVNVGFPPPRLDEKAQLASFHRAVKERLASEPSLRAQMTKTAEHLVASSFYFERRGSPKEVGGHYLCCGMFNTPIIEISILFITLICIPQPHSYGRSSSSPSQKNFTNSAAYHLVRLSNLLQIIPQKIMNADVV
jgi:hypothetical protein